LTISQNKGERQREVQRKNEMQTDSTIRPHKSPEQVGGRGAVGKHQKKGGRKKKEKEETGSVRR